MNKRDLETAGQEYARDWFCWNEKALEACPTVELKRRYIQINAHFESCASDMGAYDDKGNARSWSDRDMAADYIFNGMDKATKQYLKIHKGVSK